MYGFLLVMGGGGLGAAMRYATGLWVGDGAAATLLVNLLGSFLLGLLAAYGLLRSAPTEQALWLFFGVGFLGAFTTYSAFSRETVMMLLDDKIWAGLSFMALNTFGAVFAFGAGFLGLRALIS